ncbi:MAG: LysR family transcriptional regulator [Pseudoxanthomonas sp.]
MDRLSLYRMFVLIAETGSFADAAEAMGTSSSDLLEAVERLERQLGTQLFTGSSRKLRLTTAGARLFADLRPTSTHYDPLEGHPPSFSARAAGQLIVAAPNTVASKIIIPNIHRLLASNPKLDLSIRSSGRWGGVSNRQFDCAILIGHVPQTSLEVVRAGSLDVLNCASPKYLLERGVPEHPEDLRKNHRAVGLSSRSLPIEVWQYVDPVGRPVVVDVPSSLVVNSLGNYIKCAVEGLGLIQAPRTDVQPLIDKGFLVEFMPRFRRAPAPLSFLHARDIKPSSNVLVFIGWISRILKENKFLRNERLQ